MRFLSVFELLSLLYQITTEMFVVLLIYWNLLFLRWACVVELEVILINLVLTVIVMFEGRIFKLVFLNSNEET